MIQDPSIATYGVGYQFRLKSDAPDVQAEFVHIWTEMTHLFAQHCGALGSRLHQSDPLTFHAYAQWPSKSVYDTELNEAASAALAPLRTRLADICHPTEILFAGSIVEDLL